ncbi:pilus assembly protein [Dyella sp.]|uniref:pilus assembly protein n=1 Tax=Dyella sp. TaxID=1869338 RepID=UPI002B49B153|nr:PilC/PilY family type IV pilus protein [Dyella sp.]HKT27868.1 PilC/PilY family type IV pilus protein [Dyella sp.]
MRRCILELIGKRLVWVSILLIPMLRAAEVGTVELSPLPLDRSRAVPSLATLAVSNSVLTAGTLTFLGGYDPIDWSGVLRAVTLNADGASANTVWDVGSLLSQPWVTSSGGRTILTAKRQESGTLVGMVFESAAPFDEDEKSGLMTPAAENSVDTLEARVDYLRGVRSLELDGSLRRRGSVLGAIVHSQALYVAYPTGNYLDTWPKASTAPEMSAGAQSYAQFVERHADRPPMLYVAANDGMLHAFHAPVPTCKEQDQQGLCKAYENTPDAGRERWAYVPRAAYANLGNLTQARHFQFHPTVDATPVTRDVFFSEHGRHEWHTLLVGGLGLGGRGVYALDITDPTAVSERFPERTVLWEFDAGMPGGDAETGATYNPADLGYTYGQPAIARLANGRWAVLVPSGYFADCSKPDKPARCEEVTGTPPSYGALFVLDAQTGAVIAELKTPSINGVSSYGLSTPVPGDYDNDQIDDVAFAGDLAGNLWRFDLTAPNPSAWKVSLAYRPAQQVTQPITVMPRLFPDPVTHRFMVVFGTGKYLGDGDKGDTTLQAVYGIRDRVDSQGNATTVQHDSLQQQVLSEQTVTDAASGSNASLRTLTSNPVSAQAGGWRIDLHLAAGERVVVTPTALFNTNTVLISTLIPDGDTPSGAIMAIDAATGGARSIIGFGGASYAGALVENPPTAGSLPVVMPAGGGKLILPGIKLKGGSSALDMPLSLDGPLWRRRSWTLLTPDS